MTDFPALPPVPAFKQADAKDNQNQRHVIEFQKWFLPFLSILPI